MNILFVAHAASRGGATGVLLELMRFLKRETAHKSTILTVRGGPLEAEFARVAAPFPGAKPFRVAAQLAGAKRRLKEMEVPRRAVIERLLDGAIRLNSRRMRRVARHLAQFDVVYANSVASGEAIRGLEPLLRRGAKLVVHVHELEFALAQNEPGWSFLKERGDLFIAASGAVWVELVEKQRIRPDRVVTVHEWVDFEALLTDKEEARRALRERIGASENAVLIGGCGTIEARKGTDWWVQSAFHALRTEPNPLRFVSHTGREVRLPAKNAEADGHKSPPPLYFVWLGSGDNALARAVLRDVRAYGIEERVHFLPSSGEPKDFFAGLDIFCVASREDPFPLVAVEAAAHGVPIACFHGAGGASELVGENGGVIVPWGDPAGMGRALASLGRDSDFRVQLGRNVHRRALEMCDARKNCAHVVELLEGLR